MKLVIFLFSLVSFCSAGAIQVTIPLETIIQKPYNSSTIGIEYDKNVFTTVYKSKNQTFDDVLIPFKVVSPVSVTKQYQLTLSESLHQCESNPIDVKTKLNGSEIAKGDTTSPVDYSNINTTEKWDDYELLLEFPVINQIPSTQTCIGNIGVYVELVI